MRSLRDIAIAQQCVLIRVDYNVPLHDDGSIAHDGRIQASLDTVRYAVSQNAKVILVSHLGRPQGRDPRFSLRPIAERLSALLRQPVRFVDDCRGDIVRQAKHALRGGDILMLENLRFYDEEERDDSVFAQELAEGVDVYIDDAFGAIHRAHASIHAVAQHVKEKGHGFLIERELRGLSNIVHDPEQPQIIIMGGAKMKDKIGVIHVLAPLSQSVCLGGALANTFLSASGIAIGASKCDADAIDVARTLLADSVVQQKLLLPVDGVVATSIDAVERRIVDFAQDVVREDEMILDIGPRTIATFCQQIAHARTIFWNGPLGYVECLAYAQGTRSIAEAIAHSSAYSVLGGGDTESAIDLLGISQSFSHVSTGGGASLEYLAGKSMPGLVVL